MQACHHGIRSRRLEKTAAGRPEHGPRETNPRYVATDKKDDGQYLYERFYRKRGDMENRIKQQSQLFADRASRRNRRPDRLRPPEAGLAYALVNYIREGGLRKASMARAQRDTIRLRLLKVEASSRATQDA